MGMNAMHMCMYSHSTCDCHGNMALYSAVVADVSCHGDTGHENKSSTYLVDTYLSDCHSHCHSQ